MSPASRAGTEKGWVNQTAGGDPSPPLHLAPAGTAVSVASASNPTREPRAPSPGAGAAAGLDEGRGREGGEVTHLKAEFLFETLKRRQG